MANIKVSEMTETSTFEDGDYTMIVQANQNKKISHENMLGGIENDISTIDNSITLINTNIFNIEEINKTYAQASYEGSAIAGSSQFQNFDTFNNYGNLTPSASGVTIGAGINAVLVSCGMNLQNATNNYDLTYSGITKNGEGISQLFLELRNSNGAQGSIVNPAIIIPVQEGDIIGVYANGGETTNIRRAYLNVKAIF